VAPGRSEFCLCLEWRRIMGHFKTGGSAAGAGLAFYGGRAIVSSRTADKWSDMDPEHPSPKY
jgi:hypothetical protein